MTYKQRSTSFILVLVDFS